MVSCGLTATAMLTQRLIPIRVLDGSTILANLLLCCRMEG